MPGHCRWENDGGLTMGILDYLPGYRIDKNTVVNCAIPNSPSNGSGGGGGGGSTTPNPPGTYNPCDGTPQPVGPGGISFEKGTRLMYAAPTDCDEIPGPPVVTTTQTPQQYLMGHLDLNAAEYSYVNDPLNNVAITELTKYLISNGPSVDNANFVHWAMGYLMTNSNVSFEELLNAEYDSETVFPPNSVLSNYTELTIDNSETTIVISPQDMVKYPKFTALVKGLYNRVATTPKIIAALIKYTGFTQTSILNDLKFDKRGPIIYITPKEQLKTYNPKTKSYSYPYGRCISDDVNKHYIFLNKEFIDLLEIANGDNSDALIVLIATTILHEYVHWSDNNFGLSPSLAGEMGDLFEKDAFGGVLQYNKKNGKTYYRKQ